MSELKYIKLIEAAEILGISSSVTLNQIKQKYRNLLKQWHPDKCSDDPKTCKEMTAQINEAYTIILDYIENYRYSFKEEDIKQHLTIDSSDWWFDRFGEDPLWGKQSI